MEEKNLIDFETAIAYAQMSVHTLQHSGSEITPKQIGNEMKMLHKKFGTKDIRNLSKIISKGNK